VAKKLNRIIVTKQATHQDDARATAEAFQVLANENTVNGKLDVDGFNRDVAHFMIDQKRYNTTDGGKAYQVVAPAARVVGIGESPLARELFGGNRVKVSGWKDDLIEVGDKKKKLMQNQAHHLAAYVIAGSKYGGAIGSQMATIQDNGTLGNKKSEQDITLGKIGANLGDRIKSGEIKPQDIGRAVYSEIRTTLQKPF
jgi:hypothetical protein